MLQNDIATPWPTHRRGMPSSLDQTIASVPEGDPGYEDLLQDRPAIGRGTDERDFTRSGHTTRDPLGGRGAGRVIPF